MPSKWTRTTRRGTIRSNEVWEGDRRRTSLQLGEPGQPTTAADLVVWADPDHRVIIGQEVLLPDAPPQAVADSLRHALAHPAPGSGPPRHPRRIRVCRPDLVEALRPVTEPLGIEVELTESLPFADDLFRTFEARFGSPLHQGYLDASEVPEEVLADLFAAAAAYYRAKPWKTLLEAGPLVLECQEWTPPSRWVVALGGAKSVKGVAVYQSLRDIERLSATALEGPDLDERIRTTPTVALMFTRFTDLGANRLAEAKARGWELASRCAYPLAVATGRARESHWPTPGEARLLIAALRVLPLVAESFRDFQWLPDGLFVHRALQVPVVGEPVDVHVAYSALLRRWR